MFDNLGSLGNLAQNAAKSLGNDEKKPEGTDKPAASAEQKWGEVGETAKQVASGLQERNAKGQDVDYAALGDLGKKAAAAYNADPNKGDAQAVGKNIMAGFMSGGAKAEAEAGAAPPAADPKPEQRPEGEQPPQ